MNAYMRERASPYYSLQRHSRLLVVVGVIGTQPDCLCKGAGQKGFPNACHRIGTGRTECACKCMLAYMQAAEWAGSIGG